MSPDWRPAGSSSTSDPWRWSRCWRGPRRRPWTRSPAVPGSARRRPACRRPGRTSCSWRRWCATSSRTRRATGRPTSPSSSAASLVDDTLEVSVTDHGPGVPPEEQAQHLRVVPSRRARSRPPSPDTAWDSTSPSGSSTRSTAPIGVESPLGDPDGAPARGSGSGCPSPGGGPDEDDDAPWTGDGRPRVARTVPDGADHAGGRRSHRCSSCWATTWAACATRSRVRRRRRGAVGDRGRSHRTS